jgi:hypothetical protein
VKPENILLLLGGSCSDLLTLPVASSEEAGAWKFFPHCTELRGTDLGHPWTIRTSMGDGKGNDVGSVSIFSRSHIFFSTYQSITW